MVTYRNSRWFLALISIVVAFLLSPDLWIYLIQGYEGDSFYTLDTVERTGLIILTILLSGLILISGTFKSHFLYNSSYFSKLNGTALKPQTLIALIDLFGATGLFYLFVWLSPQAYYTYYLIIFNDLPLQFVIKDGPSLFELRDIFAMTEQPSLSLHGQGLLGRGLLVQVILYRFVIFMDHNKTK